MPVGAAVLLPLVTGLIGVLGALGGTWLGVAEARKQERRRMLAEQANTFAKQIGGASNAVDYAVKHHADRGAKAIDDAEQLVGESANVLAPVELLFDEATGKAARAARDELKAAIASLRAEDAGKAGDEWASAEKQWQTFARRAHAAIWPEKPRVAISRRKR